MPKYDYLGFAKGYYVFEFGKGIILVRENEPALFKELSYKEFKHGNNTK